MAIFKNYIAYLRNNPEGYWFKRKLYGWGWVPARWQGWAVIAAFVAFLIWNITGLPEVPSTGEMYWFFGKVIAAVVLLIAFCVAKGESPKWMWGSPKTDNNKNGPSAR